MQSILASIVAIILVPIIYSTGPRAQQEHITREIDSGMCVRSIPEPVLDHFRFKDAKFVLTNRTGTETATLRNGDKLTLKNWGCEWYSILFCVETSDTSYSRRHLGRCYEKAAQTILEVYPGNKMPWSLRKVASVLQNAARHPPKLESELEIDPGEIRTFVALDSVTGGIARRKIYFNISTGPL